MKKNSRQLLDDVKKIICGSKQSLEKSEYDSSDRIVDGFWNSINGKESDVFDFLATASKEKTRQLTASLENSIKNDSLIALRYAYQNIHKTIKAEDEASLMEDLYLGIEDKSKIEHRLEAVRGLDKFASLNPESQPMIEDLQDLLFEGTEESALDALNLLKTTFSSKIPSSNIKLAYTSLSTQCGEGFQMCPKSRSFLGYAMPMELSKCRENCIDSRKSPNGDIVCAYGDWLRVVADNQANVMSRLDNAKVESDKDYPILNDITRPGPAESDLPKEKMFEDSEFLKDQDTFYARKELLDYSTEESLGLRGLNNKQSSAQRRVKTASDNNNIKEASKMSNNKGFNLQKYINANTDTSLNDRLDKIREFFKDTITSQTPSELTNPAFDQKSKYESVTTTFEDLLEEKRTGTEDANLTLNEQLEKTFVTPVADPDVTMDESLDKRRKNEGFDSFLKTLEEQLGAKRSNN